MTATNHSDHQDIIGLLSATELDAVMEQSCDILKKLLQADAAAIFMWDCDLESISDKMIVADRNKDFKVLADAFAKSFDLQNFEASADGDSVSAVPASESFVRARILVENLPDDLELAVPRSVLKNLGDIVCGAHDVGWYRDATTKKKARSSKQ